MSLNNIRKKSISHHFYNLLVFLLIGIFLFGNVNVAEASTLDQFYYGTPDSYSGLRDTTNNILIAQQITIGLSGGLSSVKLNLQKNGNPSGNIVVSLYSDFFTSPNQSLATSNAVSASSVIDGFNEFTFADPYDVSAGQKFWLVLSGDYPISQTDNIAISYSFESPVYSGGIRGYQNSFGGWNLSSSGDFNFEIYVDAPLTPTQTPSPTNNPTPTNMPTPTPSDSFTIIDYQSAQNAFCAPNQYSLTSTSYPMASAALYKKTGEVWNFLENVHIESSLYGDHWCGQSTLLSDGTYKVEESPSFDIVGGIFVGAVTPTPTSTPTPTPTPVHNQPLTTATLSPNPNAQNEYANPVTVTLSAEAADGYNVATTYYKVDNSPQQTYTGPFTVSGDGPHTIYYWSVDNTGVTEDQKNTPFTINADLIALHPGDPNPITIGGVTIDFGNVTAGGYVEVQTSDNPAGGLPPTAFRFLGTYYEITTTAVYTGPITLKFYYDEADVNGPEANLKLFHWDGSGWENITTEVNTVENYIVGISDSLSPFAIGELANQAPHVEPFSGATINEGATYTANSSFTDTDEVSTSWTATVEYDDGAGEEPLALNPDKTFSLNHQYKDNGTYTVTVVVRDNGQATGTTTATVTVNNVKPAVGGITVPTSPTSKTTAVNVSSSFTDAGTLDTHTVVWNWGDNTTSNGTVTETNGSGSVTGSHTYTQGGLYTITLTVTDDDNGEETKTAAQYIIVYDTTKSVSSISKYTSQPGAYVPNSQVGGTAELGVSGRYSNNNPSGYLTFKFPAAPFEFLTFSPQWVVVKGNRAYMKGNGLTTTGQGTMFVSTIDGGASSQDRVRVKISNSQGTVIYDTQMGAPDTADPLTPLTLGGVTIQ